MTSKTCDKCGTVEICEGSNEYVHAYRIVRADRQNLSLLKVDLCYGCLEEMKKAFNFQEVKK